MDKYVKMTDNELNAAIAKHIGYEREFATDLNAAWSLLNDLPHGLGDRLSPFPHLMPREAARYICYQILWWQEYRPLIHQAFSDGHDSQYIYRVLDYPIHFIDAVEQELRD